MWREREREDELEINRQAQPPGSRRGQNMLMFSYCGKSNLETQYPFSSCKTDIKVTRK